MQTAHTTHAACAGLTICPGATLNGSPNAIRFGFEPKAVWMNRWFLWYFNVQSAVAFYWNIFLWIDNIFLQEWNLTRRGGRGRVEALSVNVFILFLWLCYSSDVRMMFWCCLSNNIFMFCLLNVRVWESEDSGLIISFKFVTFVDVDLSEWVWW